MGILLGYPTAQDGLSAYEEAVLNGFVGTEQDWLTSLQGTQGIPGPAPQFSVGSVIATTGNPEVNLSGTSTHPILNFKLKTGAAGVNITSTTTLPSNTLLNIQNVNSSLLYQYTGARKIIAIDVVFRIGRNVSIFGDKAYTQGGWTVKWIDQTGWPFLSKSIYALDLVTESPSLICSNLIHIPYFPNTKQLLISYNGFEQGYGCEIINVLEV